jgi:putative spermidine/putrescine transport system substrate-binding protein
VEWIGIAATATNKSGAMVVINELLSPDIQASRYDVDHGGDLPVYEPGFTPDEAFDPLKSHRLRSTSLKYDDLLSARIGTIPLEVRKIILKMWEEQVLNSPSEE